MKENWFAASQGGMDEHILLPRVFIARAKRIRPEAQKKVQLKFDKSVSKAADIHFNTLKPIRNKYQQERDNSFLNPYPTGGLLSYFNEMEELEKKLDTAYLREENRAREDYKTSILTILGHHYLGIPTFLFDLHSMRCRCNVLPNTLKNKSEITHKSEDVGGGKPMNKEWFFKFITQKEKWKLWELRYFLDITDDELTTTIRAYKDELEVHVEGEYTPSGVLLTKSISFIIREQTHNPLNILYGTSYAYK